MDQAIELRQNPDVKRVITTAFPGYKKQRAFLSAFGEHGVSINSYWGGGSRDYYAIVDLRTMTTRPLPTSTHPYFEVAARGLANQENDVVSVDHVGNVTLKILPEGFALVRTGIFCGKPSTAHVYLNPANFAKLLPAAAQGVSSAT
jgi:hypothetical protein